jgi:serine/threonine-protein kinase
MDVCRVCCSDVPAGSQYCPTCGSPLSQQHAPGVDRPGLPALAAVDGKEGISAPAASGPAHDAVTFDGTPDAAAVGAAPSDAMMRTPAASAAGRATARTVGKVEVAGRRSDDGLEPGALLAGRYRIVALLGRGGMGEVYRADDLKLAQAVALKFLPRALERDPGRLGRFLNEIRTAREVSHPNVCRVYDVGEVDGRHFLSMEYIDGEDLASLLRRIGRLPSDKALDIARQLCAGLAAAHDKGVLHRDLKPANVMLDGRGKVRLTDFGLAEVAGSENGDLAGTPGYMAPEQFAAQPASVQSDVYALGLVLYEVFTGKRVFAADTLAELRRLHEESRPPSLTSAVHDIDPAVERVILRCLEKDPHNRPASAIAVAAALPGGDPLAAALAAGETPSPGMVAAAGEEGGMRPAVAAAWLAAVVTGLVATMILAARLSVLAMLPLPYSPDVLANKAHEMLERLGVDGTPVDSASGFEWEPGYVEHVQAHDKSPVGWKDLPTGHVLLTFWYRTSPQHLIASELTGLFGSSTRVSPTAPPLDVAGMASLLLDTRGRLLRLEVVPAQVENPVSATAPAVEWKKVLSETGIDVATTVPTTPTWLPLTWADSRSAWSGSYPDLPGTPVRVEAASYRGKPVFVRVVRPWTPPDRAQPAAKTVAQSTGEIVSLILVVTLLVASAAIARRNLALGRGDRRGAMLTAVATSGLFLGSAALEANHVASPAELSVFGELMGGALFVAAWMWLLYLALEPYVRRRWPHTMISWNRLVIGRVRDPLLGRDVLLGAGVGVVLSLLELVGQLAGPWSGAATSPILPRLSPLAGPRFVLNSLFAVGFGAVFSILVLYFLLFLFRLVLRRDWLMVVAFVLLTTLQNGLRGATPLHMVVNPVIAAVMVALLLRLGFVAFGVALVFNALLTIYPLSTDLGSWYGTPTLFVFVVLAGVAIYAFRIALAGNPLLGTALED